MKPHGQFHGRFFLVWLGLGLMAAALIGWLSWRVQQHGFAPVGLLSLLVGGVLGVALVGLLKLAGHGHRLTACAGVLGLALFTAVCQHGFAYRDYRAQILESIRRHPHAAFAQAASPEFGPVGWQRFFQLRSRGGMLGFWLLDAGLIMVGAGLVAWLGTAGPFCDRCHSWYRTHRRGAVTQETARRLARVCLADLPDQASQQQIRLAGCIGGCGPVLLELTWKAGGAQGLAKTWLSAEQQTDVAAILSERGD